jgi:hypothetical protein
MSRDVAKPTDDLPRELVGARAADNVRVVDADVDHD